MREQPFDTEELEIDGVTVKVEYYLDYDHDLPWEHDCGHGPVRRSNIPHREGSSDKRPGERPLNSPDRNEYQFYYDWQAACKMARKDGWNTGPYDAPNQVQRAVQADFNFIRGYLNDDWHYVGVVVKIDDENEDSCWGFESLNNYHKEAAREMAEALVESYREQQDKELSEQIKEAAERLYWESRGMVTT